METEEVLDDYKIVIKLKLETTRGPVNRVRASNSGEIFSCHHAGGGVSVWSSKGLELRYVATPGTASTPASKIFSRDDDNYLLVTDGAAKLLVYNVFKSVQTALLVGHKDAVTALVTAPSASDSSLLCYSGARDGDLRVCALGHVSAGENVNSGMPDAVIGGSVNCEMNFGVAVCSTAKFCVYSVSPTPAPICRGELQLKHITITRDKDEDPMGEKLTEASVEWCVDSHSALVVSASNRGGLYAHRIKLAEDASHVSAQMVFNGSLHGQPCSLTTWRAPETKAKVSVSVGLAHSDFGRHQYLDNKRFQLHGGICAGEERKEKKMLGAKVNSYQMGLSEPSSLNCLKQFVDGMGEAVSFHGCAVPSEEWDGMSWYSCVCVVGDSLVVGDTAGRLIIYSKDIEGDASTKVSAHNGAINTMKYYKEKKLLLTASKDCFIKAWALSDCGTLRLSQVGQFPTAMPVTALTLSVAKDKGGETTAHVMAGDSAGGVYILRLVDMGRGETSNNDEEAPNKKRRKK